MIALGIDPGTALTGIAVLNISNNSEVPEILDCAVVKTAAGTDMSKRLHFVYDAIHELVDRHKPEIMVIEKLFFNTNVKTAMTVGQARGIYLLVAGQKGVPVLEYTALEAKMVVTGYGRSSKQEMQHAVKDYFQLDTIIKPDDANDALALLLCFINKDYSSFILNANNN